MWKPLADLAKSLKQSLPRAAKDVLTIRNLLTGEVVR
jgi:hypothetical protein